MISYIIYKLLQTLSCILPLKFSYRLAEIVAYFYYLLDRNARTSTIFNLNQAFQDRFTDEKKRLITVNIFKNFGKGMVDFCRFSKIDRRFVNRYVKIKNLNYIDEILKERGVIGLTAHIGNWELGGATLSILGYPVNVVALPHSRKKVENFFIKQRSIKGAKVIPLGDAYRLCYERLLSKQFVALLLDRKYTGTGIMATCFGKPIKIPKGPGVLSLKANVPIVSGYMIRKNGYFELIFEEPIYPKSIQGETYQEKLNNLVQKYADTMEKFIRKYPDQWFLFYKLFIE